MKLVLDDDDLKDLYKLYTTIEPYLNRIKMPESIYELNCEHCGNEWELSYIEEDDSDEPLYCPFCGCDVDLSDVEESFDDDDDFGTEELDFEKD
jgi:uncharacterized radical SAM superfamily protein